MNIFISPAPPWYIAIRFLSFWFLILIPICMVLIWFILKNKRKLRKVLLIIFTVIFLASLIVFDTTRYSGNSVIAKAIKEVTYWKRSTFQEVPIDIRGKSDSYIVNILGEENFNKWIHYVPGDSYRSGESSYHLTYSFDPYAKYGNFPITMEVNDGKIKMNDYRIKLPTCALDNYLCQFNLSGTDYKKLIQKYNADDSIYINPPYIYAELCPEKKYMSMNYVTNEISDELEHLPYETSSIRFGPCPVIYY